MYKKIILVKYLKEEDFNKSDFERKQLHYKITLSLSAERGKKNGKSFETSLSKMWSAPFSTNPGGVNLLVKKITSFAKAALVEHPSTFPKGHLWQVITARRERTQYFRIQECFRAESCRTLNIWVDRQLGHLSRFGMGNIYWCRV
ncbi:hypothetical protein CDAR_496551 [Caerostris darwini]|uniref:Ribosomal protein S14 n=1 Tax=Caerostris darwini TaxID=1538125 RepID=A0AAV4QDY6_9ARAC|nr:hypothetical protein CDAR_496551 [Caerostris darwini]